MKIWIDLTNSPHVNFFSKIIRDLQREHEVILTCRPLANTIELLNIEGFEYSIVGSHYGANKIYKILGFVIRVCQLFKFLRKTKIDLSVSHSSYYSPVVSRLLGAPCVYLNDNEHAKGNIIAFAFAEKVLVPEAFPVKRIASSNKSPKKFIQYPGVKEGVYLWHFCPEKNSDSSLESLGLDPHQRTIFIRPEPWAAHYYRGKKDFLDKLICDLAEDNNVVILPRGEAQEGHYRQEKFSSAFVVHGSVRLSDIVTRCNLFIGAGGTMTREAAVLGMPTISVYQDKLLDVDKYLIVQKRIIHNSNPDSKFVRNFLNDHEPEDFDFKMKEKGKVAYDLIINNILQMGSQKTKNVV